MVLHDATILFLVAVVAAVNGGVFASAGLMTPRRNAGPLWSAAAFLLAASAISVWVMPEHSIWRPVAFNVPVLLSHAFLLAGVLLFLGYRDFGRVLALVTGVAIVAGLWLTFVQPNRDLRVFVTAITGCGLRLTAAWFLIRIRGPHARGAAIVAAAVLAAEGLLLLDHALAGLAGKVGWVGDDATSRWFTWLGRLITAAVSLPLLMLLGLSRLIGELRDSANHDHLTGLCNRRGFAAVTGVLLAHAKRNGAGASVLMLDIDRFKRLNDRFGHAVGDEVLKAMGKTLRNTLRGSDVAVRWGGEEFCALLLSSDGKGSHSTAERIRQEFTQACKKITALRGGNVSVSIGIAYGMLKDNSFDDLQKQADQALYAAKEAGRDRVMAGNKLVVDG